MADDLLQYTKNTPQKMQAEGLKAIYNDSFRERYGAAPIAIHKTVGFMPTYPHIHKEIELLYIVEGYSKIKISDTLYEFLLQMKAPIWVCPISDGF